jgi:hypothetical protein
MSNHWTQKVYTLLVYLSLPTCQPANLPICQSSNLPICQSANLPICQSANLPACLPAYPLSCLLASLPSGLPAIIYVKSLGPEGWHLACLPADSAFLPSCLPAFLLACLSARLSACLPTKSRMWNICQASYRCLCSW